MARSSNRSLLLAQRAAGMRSSPASSEAALFAALRAGALDGVRFKCQVVIGNFIVDLLAPREEVVVEVDGGYPARCRTRDARRDRVLTRLGYRVLHLDAALVLHAVALARVAALDILSGLENSPLPRARLLAENERLRSALAASDDEKRILRARLAHIPPARRPHYPPVERLAILTVRAAQGWIKAETARRFVVSPQTLAAWMKRLDDDGSEALVQPSVPVNRYPDFVALAVQRLKPAGAAMGRKRIANTLARAGLHLAPSTVRRMLQRKPVPPPDRDDDASAGSGSGNTPDTNAARVIDANATRVVTSKHPHHLWQTDLTLLPTVPTRAVGEKLSRTPVVTVSWPSVGRRGLARRGGAAPLSG